MIDIVSIMTIVLMMMMVTMIDRGGGHWAALERRADEAIRAV